MSLKEAQHKLSSDITQLYETYQLISKNKKQFNELDVALLQQQLLYIYHSLLHVQSQLGQVPASEEVIVQPVLQPVPEATEMPVPVQPEPRVEEAGLQEEITPVEIPVEPEQPELEETHAPVVPPPPVVEELPEPTLDELEERMKEQEKKEEEEQLSLLAPEPVNTPVIPVVKPEETPKPQVTDATISLLDKLSATMRGPDVYEKISRESQQSLKQAINLNKKIAFVNNLFNENTVEYAKAIEKLNAATGLHEALRYFTELKHQYNWNNENALVKDLEQLIEKRFA